MAVFEKKFVKCVEYFQTRLANKVGTADDKKIGFFGIKRSETV